MKHPSGLNVSGSFEADIKNKMKTTKKVVKLPLKPVTKRDKHMYDLGAEQQAEVFANMTHAQPCNHKEVTPGSIIHLTEEEFSRKSLGDRQEAITNEKDYTCVIVSIIVFVLVILMAHPYILAWVNNN